LAKVWAEREEKEQENFDHWCKFGDAPSLGSGWHTSTIPRHQALPALLWRLCEIELLAKKLVANEAYLGYH
jgi:hypothetical protein